MNKFIEDLIKNRRSVSSFSNKEVDPELIDKLISIAGYAPSSCNTQPWFFLIFLNKESQVRLNWYIKQGYERTSYDFSLNHKLVGNIYIRLLDFFYNYGKFDLAPVLILLFSRPYDTPVFSQAIKLSGNFKIKSIADDSVKTSCAMAM